MESDRARTTEARIARDMRAQAAGPCPIGQVRPAAAALSLERHLSAWKVRSQCLYAGWEASHNPDAAVDAVRSHGFAPERIRATDTTLPFLAKDENRTGPKSRSQPRIACVSHGARDRSPLA